MSFDPASNTTNVRMGTCRITYDGVDLGYTMGGVEVEVTTSTHETKVDQFGDVVAGEFIMGRTITCNVPMAETTLDNMVLIMPGATKIVDTAEPTKVKVTVKTGVGTNLLAQAKQLILHPISMPEADLSEDLIIPLAATPGGMSFAYKYDEERVFNAEFKGYPSSDGTLFIYGDQTATAV